MKELLVISGKGGTGKTTIVGAFAALAESKVLADCDVDAADLHLLLRPEVRHREEFFGSRKAAVDPEKCTGCGICLEVCRFGAVRLAGGRAEVDAISCEGCAVCFHACPRNAISMRDHLSGHLFVSDTSYGPVVHARLGIAEENSGKLVAEVRRQARSIAESQGLDYVITDGPPGIGCPVISSMSGVDVVLIVTEPTVAGCHDLERVLELARHFNAKVLVCINKYDLHDGKSREIEEYCRTQGIRVAGKVRFDEDVVHAQIKGHPVVARASGQGCYKGRTAAEAIRELWDEVLSCL